MYLKMSLESVLLFLPRKVSSFSLTHLKNKRVKKTQKSQKAKKEQNQNQFQAIVINPRFNSSISPVKGNSCDFDFRMGVVSSCPFSSDVQNELDSVIVKSIDFGDDESKTLIRSISFKDRDSEPTVMKSLGLRRMVLERSISFKGKELERMLSTKSISSDKEFSPKFNDSVSEAVFDTSKPAHEAATKLQKVYKSFRTRRKLADCAVLVEQSWWKLLDFAELKRSSISFFDIEKHETAISRWSRARTRAAKVGKGLSKNEKAQKLALQHWLEAIDPRHRYGHNLHFYYNQWLHSQSKEPFFYWLDIGEGKEVNLIEKCPRTKLQEQCIKYLGPMERVAYEVVIDDGKFLYKQSGDFLQTTEDAKMIFVLSTSKTLYVGQKKKGTFQHSSFLAGGATVTAGRLVVENGVLQAVWPHSGHYRPTKENFTDFISFLEENNVDLTNVKMTPVDEEESSLGKQRSSKHLRCDSSEEETTQTWSSLEPEEANARDLARDQTDSTEEEAAVALERSSFRDISRNLTSLEIPKRDELFGSLQNNELPLGPNDDSVNSPLEEATYTPKEKILERINSKKLTNSYQLGKQLSCKWTTGAGPRIGCVRDYPSELQFRALEQVSLSPRSAGNSKSYFSPQSCLSPKVSSPSCPDEAMTASFTSPLLRKGSILQKGIPYRTQSTPLLKEALVGLNGSSS